MAGVDTQIFATQARRHWAMGLPVIPIKRGSKRPAINAWSLYQGQMPSEAEQAGWLESFGDCGIGLPLGPQSRMFGLDVDTDDQAVLSLVRKLAPKTPWERRGKKGLVFGFRYADQKIVRVRYRDKETGKLATLIDMLGAGSQVVLPPSIHPDTGEAYWATADLVDVIGKLPLLGGDFEDRLRDGLRILGWDIVAGGGGGAGAGAGFGAVTDMISLGARDSTLVGLAGLFSRDVMKGHLTVRQAVVQIQAKVEVLMEKTYGDNVDGGKGVEKFVEFLKKDMLTSGRPLPLGWDDDLDHEIATELGLGPDNICENDVVWTAEEIRSWFMTEVSVVGVKDDPVAYLGVAKEAIYKISRNGTMEELEKESLLKLISDMSNRGVSLTSVRRQLSRLKQGPIEGLSHSEIAREALERIEEVSGAIKTWNEYLWQWTGSHWEKVDDGLVLQFVIKEYGDLKAGLRSADHNGIVKTIRALRRGELCTVEGGVEAVRGINFVNGFLRKDMELVEHSPDYGMTYCLPYAYEVGSEGKCGKFLRMLAQYWGEDEDYRDKVECLAEMICLTLFGMMTEVEKAVCLYGVANSGKSRIIEIIQKLLPEAVSTTVPPDTWGERFSVVHLTGKLLNFAGELSEHGVIDGMKFKTIVSGQIVSAEEKGLPKFNFRPQSAHWFSSNYLPRSKDSSHGFIRRWIILSFSRMFKDEEVIRGFEREIVAEERAAIVAWAVSRMPGLIARGLILTEPASSRAQKSALENDLNSVRAFLWDYKNAGRIVMGLDAHNALLMKGGGDLAYSSFDAVYHAYRSYCVSQAISPSGSKTMIKRMEMLQGTFGFKIDQIYGPGGTLIQVYRLLSLVDPSKTKLSRVA